MNSFDKYKTEIDLTEFAGSLGYELNKKKSSSKYKVLEKNGEVVIVSHNNTTGEDYYYNSDRSSDKGDIISFAKKRVHMLGSLEVPEYVKDQDMYIINQALGNFKGYVFQEPINKAPKKNSSFNKNIYTYYPAKDFKVLNERGIETKVVNDPLFKDRVMNSEFKGKVNIAFPLYDRKENTIGFDFRSKGVKKLATGTDRENGMWTSNKPEKIDNIVVAESPIDLISYHQLFPGKNNYYMATHGSITEKHIERIIAESRESGAKIALAQDADEAGYTMSLKVIAAASNISLKPVQERMMLKMDKETWKKVSEDIISKGKEINQPFMVKDKKGKPTLGKIEDKKHMISGGEKEGQMIVQFPAREDLLKFFCETISGNLNLNISLDMPTKGKDYNEQLELQQKKKIANPKISMSM